MHCCWGCEVVQPLWEAARSFLRCYRQICRVIHHPIGVGHQRKQNQHTEESPGLLCLLHCP